MKNYILKELFLNAYKLGFSRSDINPVISMIDKLTKIPVERNIHNECYSCKFRKKIPGSAHSHCANPDPFMEGNQHGIDNGWFIYPLNFDPAWKLRQCSMYIPKK